MRPTPNTFTTYPESRGGALHQLRYVSIGTKTTAQIQVNQTTIDLSILPLQRVRSASGHLRRTPKLSGRTTAATPLLDAPLQRLVRRRFLLTLGTGRLGVFGSRSRR